VHRCRAGRFTRVIGGTKGRILSGHRRGVRAGVLNTEIYDEVIRVKNDDAFDLGAAHGTRRRSAGGHLIGAAVWAALELARRPENDGKLIVVIIPSFGERYLSTALFADLAD
jgi:cysteine synthase A